MKYLIIYSSFFYSAVYTHVCYFWHEISFWNFRLFYTYKICLNFIFKTGRPSKIIPTNKDPHSSSSQKPHFNHTYTYTSRQRSQPVSPSNDTSSDSTAHPIGYGTPTAITALRGDTRRFTDLSMIPPFALSQRALVMSHKLRGNARPVVLIYSSRKDDATTALSLHCHFCIGGVSLHARDREKKERFPLQMTQARIVFPTAVLRRLVIGGIDRRSSTAIVQSRVSSMPLELIYRRSRW